MSEAPIPNKPRRRDAKIYVACFQHDKERLKQMAFEEGYSLSSYVRMLANIGWREHEKTRPRPNSKICQ